MISPKAVYAKATDSMNSSVLIKVVVNSSSANVQSRKGIYFKLMTMCAMGKAVLTIKLLNFMTRR